MTSPRLWLANRFLISALITAAIVVALLLIPSSPVSNLLSSAFGYGYGWPGEPPPPPPLESPIPTPEPTPTVTPTPTPPSDQVTEDVSDSIDASGIITEDIVLTSTDGSAVAEIPTGTTALDSEGNPLDKITVQPPVIEAPVPPAMKSRCITTR